jgi:hypothetical protein
VPYAVGPFLVFAYGDLVCLKLKLYKDNYLFGLQSSISVESYDELKLNVTRSTTGLVIRESQQYRASTAMSIKSKDNSPQIKRDSWQ